MDTGGIKEPLYQNLEHPRWEDVASRCLSCANCTLVCPTCFCTTVEDVTDLAGQSAERQRKWDSCFTMDFSYIHGGAIRTSTCSRYRQWMTHKLASWIDQFGTPGCVGCGRCITWCPVGIDITRRGSSDPRRYAQAGRLEGCREHSSPPSGWLICGAAINCRASAERCRSTAGPARAANGLGAQTSYHF